MPKYLVVCPSCNSEFLSYEEYISHVFEKHEDQPSIRMQAKIIKKEINETQRLDELLIFLHREEIKPGSLSTSLNSDLYCR
jgi:hypothetical protein